MELTPLSQLNDWSLVHEDQDIRGWPVKDETGRLLGKVSELLVNKEAEKVGAIKLDNGQEFPAQAIDPDFNQHAVILHDGLDNSARGAGVMAGTGRAQISGAGAGISRESDRLEQTEQRSGGADARAGYETIPIAEEELQVGKREVEKGWVRVHSHVVSKPVHEEVTLREEHVEVERHKVDRPATDADFQEKTITAREVAEEPDVQKKAHVVEEVALHKEASQHTENINESVRHTEVNVDKPHEGRAAGPNRFEDYDADFRRDYQSRYADQGGRYEDYQQAYRYGCELASKPRYQGKDWHSIEPLARRDWESQHDSGSSSTWDRFKDAIEHGWNKVTGQT